MQDNYSRKERESKDDDQKANLRNSSTVGTMAVTTAVNSATSMMKDKFYASQFNGAVNKNLKLPLISFGMWGIRDCTTIASSFILPNHVGDMLHTYSDLDRGTAKTLSQIVCPVVAQFVAAPVHILGLDFFNRPLTNLSMSAAFVERMRFQYNNFVSILTVRIARVAPAYGLGGVGNNYLRDSFREYVE